MTAPNKQKSGFEMAIPEVALSFTVQTYFFGTTQ